MSSETQANAPVQVLAHSHAGIVVTNLERAFTLWHSLLGLPFATKTTMPADAFVTPVLGPSLPVKAPHVAIFSLTIHRNQYPQTVKLMESEFEDGEEGVVCKPRQVDV